MVLLRAYFLHESDPRRIISRLFFIHFVAPCASFHLAVKILLQIFQEDLSTLALHTLVIVSAMPADRTYATNTIGETLIILIQIINKT